MKPVEPGHLVEPAAHESDGVRLPAVDHALLERGVNLAVVHRGRLDAQRGIGRQVRCVLEDPQLEAGEILRRFDGSAPVVDVAEPVVEEAKRANSRALEEEIAPGVSHGAVHHREPVVPVLEEEREIEHLPFGHPARKHRGARDGQVNRAGLDLFEGDALAPELSRRIDDDPEPPAVRSRMRSGSAPP